MVYATLVADFVSDSQQRYNHFWDWVQPGTVHLHLVESHVLLSVSSNFVGTESWVSDAYTITKIGLTVAQFNDRVWKKLAKRYNKLEPPCWCLMRAV